MPNRPIGERLLGGQVRRWQRVAGGFEHAQVQTVRFFVVEAEAEEGETDDRAQFARQAAEERVAIVISPKGLRHTDEGLIPGDG